MGKLYWFDLKEIYEIDFEKHKWSLEKNKNWYVDTYKEICICKCLILFSSKIDHDFAKQ